ncbi:MAG: IS21 family transposase [Acidobacteria bacterium]|nr:IS21 family transposase [Acidobacteriota bacterium]
MSNVLSEQAKQQVIALGRLGWSLRRIQQETGVRRETASVYLKAAGIQVPPPGRRKQQPAKPAISVTTGSPAELAAPCSHSKSEPLPQRGGPQTAKPAISVTTGFGVESSGLASQHGTATASTCEPFREAIESGLSRGRNAMAIWQDLVAEAGFSGSYQTVKRFVRKLRGTQPPQARAVIVTAPGEEAQVDYGQKGPMVRDAQSGKYRRTRLFVLTLGYSRKSVRQLTFRSTSRIWAELHEKAFRRLGGSTRVVVLDNLKEGVLVPDMYDPTLNPLYRDVLAHYGTMALPCRIQDPDRKGKVESGVGYAQRTPLKGKRFESLEEAQGYLDRWEANWADTRIHGTTKRQVAAMFAEEKPALLPLPLEPFRYYQFGERTVHLDGCVEVEAAYYSAPPGWIGRLVKVQWDGTVVRILDPKTGQLMREHFRQKRGQHRFERQDGSPRTPLRVHQLLWRTERAGSHIGVLCRALHHRQGAVAVRRIQGVLALAKKFGSPAVDKACALALDMQVPEYRFVKHYLEHCPPAPLSLQQVDPLIRNLVEYRDLIQQKTKEDPIP